MAIFSHEHHHWAYNWVPIFTAFIWFSLLLSMILTWVGTGRPHYVSQDGDVPFISDIGADILKPWFIVGCSITGAGFVLTLLIARVLRNHGRLVANMRRREKVFAWLAVLGALIGAAGLVLLSVFDTKRHTMVHRGCLLIFMVGVALSAIFSIIEYRWISKDFGGYRALRKAYIMKGVVAGLLIAAAIAFAGTLYGNSKITKDVAGILEWVISFGFTLYLLTFAYDLHMSKGRRKGELSRDALMAQHGGLPVGGPAYGDHGHYANNGYASHGGYRPSTDTYGTSGAPRQHAY